ncbi:unnamed protein product [Acanthoscelides obtectus]|uniref:Uncharacterized protein n=1 Tax=Acanthoscelides obtectus TaxID=200917 RepID=A0A9P0JUA6_ACAOB|nr:unnamed protein product [Acanthoscelides obtectus]CAK1640809.1 hypothetical protein AOBTE_LOCUS11941 [Acanthoscelides obtectus]
MAGDTDLGLSQTDKKCELCCDSIRKSSTSANRSPSENCQFEYFEDSDDSCRDPDFIPSDHTSDEEIESVSLSASVAYETEMNSPREANERTATKTPQRKATK